MRTLTPFVGFGTALTLLALTGCASVQRPIGPTAKLLSYGTYTAEIIQHIPAPTIFRDADLLGEPTLVSQTTNIPCKIGTHFGVLFDVEGLKDEQFPYSLTVVWKFPKLTRPDGEESSETKGRWPIDKPSTWATKEIPIGWKFEEPFELVSGTWTVEIYYAEHSILRQSFHVACP